jgi:hypothetical protein
MRNERNPTSPPSNPSPPPWNSWRYIVSLTGIYRVPARSRVMINAWAIGRDPNARAVRLVAVPTYRLNCSFWSKKREGRGKWRSISSVSYGSIVSESRHYP